MLPSVNFCQVLAADARRQRLAVRLQPGARRQLRPPRPAQAQSVYAQRLLELTKASRMSRLTCDEAVKRHCRAQPATRLPKCRASEGNPLEAQPGPDQAPWCCLEAGRAKPTIHAGRHVSTASERRTCIAFRASCRRVCSLTT